MTYAKDTHGARGPPIREWEGYFSGGPAKPARRLPGDKELRGYQTVPGRGPDPVSDLGGQPGVDRRRPASPDQADGFVYFVAIPDSDEHAFAKTLAEPNANLRKYGYL